VKLAVVWILTAFNAASAADSGYIVAMYSAKETRGLGGYFDVSVDGKKVARLRYGTYFRLAVPPGAYEVTMDAPSKSHMLCHLIAGETCYVRARLVGKENRREADLVSPEEAGRQLRNTIPLEKEKVYMEVWKKE
jgi:hypothetical protein